MTRHWLLPMTCFAVIGYANNNLGSPPSCDCTFGNDCWWQLPSCWFASKVSRSLSILCLRLKACWKYWALSCLQKISTKLASNKHTKVPLHRGRQIFHRWTCQCSQAVRQRWIDLPCTAVDLVLHTHLRTCTHHLFYAVFLMMILHCF